jgi:hypothetical protein
MLARKSEISVSVACLVSFKSYILSDRLGAIELLPVALSESSCSLLIAAWTFDCSIASSSFGRPCCRLWPNQSTML